MKSARSVFGSILDPIDFDNLYSYNSNEAYFEVKKHDSYK